LFAIVLLSVSDTERLSIVQALHALGWKSRFERSMLPRYGWKRLRREMNPCESTTFVSTTFVMFAAAFASPVMTTVEVGDASDAKSGVAVGELESAEFVSGVVVGVDTLLSATVSLATVLFVELHYRLTCSGQ